MIKRLKRKIVLLAGAGSVILMALLVGIMNLVNLSNVTADADSVLEMLSRPGSPFGFRQDSTDRPPREIKDLIPHGMSPEVPYESRYFTATVNADGEIIETDISKIISVDSSGADDYVRRALERKNTKGFLGQFRYFKQANGNITRIIFLDCGRKLDSFHSFLRTSIAVGLLGCVAVFVIFFFAADRIVRPLAESREKQKRFITDAGHEIKTPLTIIGANLDLLEEDVGENEYLDEIRTQTKHLTSLTGDLVYLSKMEEGQNALIKTDFPVSDLASETARNFRAIANAEKKNFDVNIQPGVSMYGSPDSVRRLISILLDNAMKYSPQGGSVSVKLYTKKKQLFITVYNDTVSDISQENTQRIFDRFYRTDASRNSETGGHGIGLSVAKAITEAHNGSISAQTSGNRDFSVCVIMPLQ